MFDLDAIAEFRADAAARWPEEACGFLTVDGYRPARNIAADPLIDFRIDEAEFVAAGRVLAVLHSHTHARDGDGALVASPLDWPSLADQISQEALGLPFGIAVVTASASGEIHVDEPFFFGAGIDPPPLVGRPFRHRVTDCYALVRDWWRAEGVVLPDYVRDDGWWRRGGDLYRDHFAAAGFRIVAATDPRPGDCFLAQLHSPVPNHAGVHLGAGLILHHPHGCLSKRDPLSRWQRHITHWLRHESRS